MRVLVLSTTRRVSNAWLEEYLAPLAPRELTVSVVLLTNPDPGLRVDRCLVVGNRLRPGRAVAEVPRPRGPRPAQPRLARWADRLTKLAAPASWQEDRNLALASGTAWSRRVRAEFARADLVIAADWNTTYAAWLLARRVPGPEVVFGVDGALLKFSEIAQSGGPTL